MQEENDTNIFHLSSSLPPHYLSPIFAGSKALFSGLAGGFIHGSLCILLDRLHLMALKSFNVVSFHELYLQYNSRLKYFPWIVPSPRHNNADQQINIIDKKGSQHYNSVKLSTLAINKVIEGAPIDKYVDTIYSQSQTQMQQNKPHMITKAAQPILNRLPLSEFPSIRGTLLSHALTHGLMFSSYETVKTIGFNAAHFLWPDAPDSEHYGYPQSSYRKEKHLDIDSTRSEVNHANNEGKSTTASESPTSTVYDAIDASPKTPMAGEKRDETLFISRKDRVLQPAPAHRSSTFYSILGVAIVGVAGGCAGIMEELSSHLLSTWEKEGVISLRKSILMNGIPRTAALMSSIFPSAIGMIAYEYGKDTFEENL